MSPSMNLSFPSAKNPGQIGPVLVTSLSEHPVPCLEKIKPSLDSSALSDSQSRRQLGLGPGWPGLHPAPGHCFPWRESRGQEGSVLCCSSATCCPMGDRSQAGRGRG